MKAINWKSPDLYGIAFIVWMMLSVIYHVIVSAKPIVLNIMLASFFIVFIGGTLKFLSLIKKPHSSIPDKIIRPINWKDPVLYYSLSMIWMMFCVVLLGIAGEKPIISNMLIIGFFIALPGVLLKTVPFVKKLCGSVFGQIIIGFLTSLICSVSYSVSLHIIHSALKINPEKFSIPTAILAMFIAIPVWVGVFLILLFIFAIVRMLYYIFLDFSWVQFFAKDFKIFRKNKYAVLENFAFFFVVIAICYLISTTGDLLGKNKNWLSERLTSSIVFFSFYSESECKNLKKNDKYIYLDDGRVYVAYLDYQNGQYFFKKVVCQS